MVSEVYKKHGFKWSISFYPTWECNLNCPYCGSNNIYRGLMHGPQGGSLKGEFREEPAGADGETWARRFNRLPGAAMIDISGGEPFLWPHLIEFLKHLDFKHRMAITTNLTQPVEEFCDAVTAFKVCEFTLSCHLCNPGWRDTFWERVDYLKRYHFWIRINFVAYPSQIDKIETVERLAREHHVEFTLEPYAGGAPEPFEGYTKEELAFLSGRWGGDVAPVRKEMAGEHDKGGGRIRTKRCTAGKTRFMVAPDGAMYPCNQTYMKRVHYLGNFLTDSPPFREEEWLLCDLDCSCTGDRVNVEFEEEEAATG